GAFHFIEHLADLLPRGSMNARISHAGLPIRKINVLRRQALKTPALERVLLTIINPRFDFSFVTRHRRAGREHHGAIVAAELFRLWVEFGIKPVSPRYGSPQVVGD